MIRKHMTYENTYRDDTRALDRKQNLPTRKKLTDSITLTHQLLRDKVYAILISL